MTRKNIRKATLVIIITLIMVYCLTGCNSKQSVIIGYNDECIWVSSTKLSEFAVAATVEYSEGKTITILHQVELEESNSKIIKIQELNDDLFNEYSKITSATVIIRENQEVAPLFWASIGICIGMVLTVLSQIKADHSDKSTKNSPQ